MWALIFYSFAHSLMLQIEHLSIFLECFHWEPSSISNGRMWNNTITADLTGLVNDHNNLILIFGQPSCKLPQTCGLSRVRPSNQQHASCALQQVGGKGIQRSFYSLANAGSDSNH